RRQPLRPLIGIAGVPGARLRLAFLQVGAQRFGKPVLGPFLLQPLEGAKTIAIGFCFAGGMDGEAAFEPSPKSKSWRPTNGAA
ncbi:hypothetical protein, partial [Mesorhizobium sp. M1C.F.Ca.ET.189.01.1.1]|uniref:hypothetical protein n=1 Tax=Mesorhizobium sp. M1C.F.Ca.ET.189.01.1.1 TaxID=2563925 RepID=UPI001AEDAC22